MKLQEFLVADLKPAPKQSRFDWLSPDDNWAITALDQPAGTRELHSLILKLVTALHERKAGAAPSHGCLVFAHPALSPTRLAAEWDKAIEVLSPRYSGSLAILTPHMQRGATLPATLWADHLRKALQAVPFETPEESGEVGLPPLTEKSFEVLKVILSRWLRSSSPLPIGKIQELTGFSYPTVARTIRRLRAYNEVRHGSDRSVLLTGFLDRSWGEALASIRSLRRSYFFRDASGRAPDLEYLLERIERTARPKPSVLALSGTEGARFFDPSFDLNGIPRIDLVLHDPIGKSPPDAWVKAIDPALKPAAMPDSNATLVIHCVRREQSLFEDRPSKSLPVSDPAEILLDLADLRLSGQAEDLTQKLLAKRTHGQA